MPHSHLTAATCAMREKLDTIISTLTVLKDDRLTDTERRRFLDLATAASREMVDVIARADELAAIKKGIAGAAGSAVDVLLMLDWCVNIARAEAIERQLDIAIATPAELPQLLADERRIKRALLDLLSYVIRATPCGGVITVSVSLADGMTVSISGTGVDQVPDAAGPAMPPVDRPVDHRGDFDTLVAEELIRLHGGSLRLVRHAGYATTAIVDFPQRRLLNKRGTSVSALRTGSGTPPAYLAAE